MLTHSLGGAEIMFTAVIAVGWQEKYKIQSAVDVRPVVLMLRGGFLAGTSIIAYNQQLLYIHYYS